MTTTSAASGGVRPVACNAEIDSPGVTQLQHAELTVAGLFAGVGGIELGLQRAGHRSALLCEIDPAARAVLDQRFPEVPCERDIRELAMLPEVDVCAAGFPCQDLSQAGRTAGISGSRSSLVEHVFRLLDDAIRCGVDPRWLLLENVPFMLRLDRGRAMRYLVHELERRDYRWAYRIVDTRAFGLPQRRKRVLLVASRSEEPREVLFSGDESEPVVTDTDACGFYWTEGIKGLGRAEGAVPTLKAGSGLGIPSPPAIWIRSERLIVTPTIQEAEQLQGFGSEWTAPAETTWGRGGRARWKLVGNAVSVPVATWVGDRLRSPTLCDGNRGTALAEGDGWPSAAWGEGGAAYAVELSHFPVREPLTELLQVVTSRTPLSERATAGFLSRARQGRLRFPPGFLEDVEYHLERMRATVRAA